MSLQTVVERNGSSIIYRCQSNVDVPNVDVLTLLFEKSPTQDNSPIHIDAEDPTRVLTKASCRNITERIAHALRNKYGVGNTSRDYVTCLSSGNFFLPCVFYGIVAAGGIFSSVPASAVVKEVAYMIKLASSNLVICNEDTKDVAIEAARISGIPTNRVLLIDSSKLDLVEVSSGKPILTSSKLSWKKITSSKALEEEPLTLIFSSGTTGFPKAVPLSHRNVVAEAVTTIDMIRPQMRKTNPSFEYRTLAHLPVAHIAGMQGYFINPFYFGGPTYWMSKFDFLKFLEYNKKFRITFFFTVPPIYLLIAKMEMVKDQFDDLQWAISGAAPMGKELQEAASKRLGKGKTWISQTWGLSESCGSATLLGIDEKDDTGSVSRLLPNVSARIVDEDGHDMPPEKEGEVYLKGPIIFRGYHNNPDANKDSFDNDGWFKTGDIGMFKDGLLYIVDRKKELIKYKGLQIAPAELEAHLLSHPNILDVAVIGVEWEGTEAPRAYVVAKNLNEEDVKRWVKDHLAKHKQLRGGVKFIDAIPKSPSGKILRKNLRALAQQDKARSKL